MRLDLVAVLRGSEDLAPACRPRLVTERTQITCGNAKPHVLG